MDTFNCSNSINMSNEVFESIDEVSSRTASADKISTITEVTENDTSNSEKTRVKLLSTQSEPPNDTQTRMELLGSDEGISGSQDGLNKNGVHYDTDGEINSMRDKEEEMNKFVRNKSPCRKHLIGSGSLRRKKRNIKRVDEVDEEESFIIGNNKSHNSPLDVKYK